MQFYFKRNVSNIKCTKHYNIQFKIAHQYQLLPNTKRSPMPNAHQYQMLTNDKGSPMPNAHQHQMLTNTKCSPIPNAKAKYSPMPNTHQCQVLTNAKRCLSMTRLQYCLIFAEYSVSQLLLNYQTQPIKQVMTQLARWKKRQKLKISSEF